MRNQNIFMAVGGGGGRGGGVEELGHLLKISSNAPEIEAPQGNILDFFSPRYS